jgi:hypothetical protein
MQWRGAIRVWLKGRENVMVRAADAAAAEADKGAEGVEGKGTR